jgi:hypothetical protein
MSKDSRHLMKTIPFGWTGQTPLHSELAKPIKRISSFSIFPTSGIERVTIWREDGTGIRISNRMHDVAEKIEVGVLSFEVVDSEEKLSSSDQLKTVDLDAAFLGRFSIAKLIIEESGMFAESGIRLEASNGQSVTIVASGAPCTLFIVGVELAWRTSVPEYPLADYQIVEL